jgi:glycerate-2-kinase
LPSGIRADLDAIVATALAPQTPGGNATRLRCTQLHCGSSREAAGCRKAAAAMARAFVQASPAAIVEGGDRTGGTRGRRPTSPLVFHAASHPVPDERSERMDGRRWRWRRVSRRTSSVVLS